MGKFVPVAKKAEVADGKGTIVHVGDQAIALFRLQDEYFAMSNTCLHRGGPLGEGELSGHMVTCPWHGWKYDVSTGAFSIIPQLKLRTFNVKIDEGTIFVEV